jgi:hypothetical protein
MLHIRSYKIRKHIHPWWRQSITFMVAFSLKLSSLCFQVWRPPNNGGESLSRLSTVRYDSFLTIAFGVLFGITTASGSSATSIEQPVERRNHQRLDHERRHVTIAKWQAMNLTVKWFRVNCVDNFTVIPTESCTDAKHRKPCQCTRRDRHRQYQQRCRDILTWECGFKQAHAEHHNRGG